MDKAQAKPEDGSQPATLLQEPQRSPLRCCDRANAIRPIRPYEPGTLLEKPQRSLLSSAGKTNRRSLPLFCKQDKSAIAPYNSRLETRFFQKTGFLTPAIAPLFCKQDKSAIAPAILQARRIGDRSVVLQARRIGDRSVVLRARQIGDRSL